VGGGVTGEKPVGIPSRKEGKKLKEGINAEIDPVQKKR